MSRWRCAQQTVELAKAEERLGSVNVFPCWPGDKWMSSQVIWGVDTDGEQTYGPVAAGPQIVDDRYVQRWAMRVGDQPTVEDAMARIDEIVSAFRKAISATASLDTLRGDGWEVVETGGGQLSTNGIDTADGPIAVAVFDQYVELRITTGET